MKVPYSWLKEIVSFDLSPNELADQLTLLGLEAEGVEEHFPPFEGVVVGEVLECQQHPDADKLSVTKTTDGTDEFQVVCGAANCRTGLRVALARVGAKLFDEAGGAFKIKKSKIRGVESLGMLCAEEELGLADSSDGIWELGEEFPLGKDLRQHFSETVLEIALTPNLSHCNSMQGIAREVAALVDTDVKMPEFAVKEEGPKTESLTSVSIDTPEACPRYACRMIKGLKVGPSPEWLKRRLEACGMRSVNNIVDVTNYVLMEYGHPLHAFDFDRLDEGRIHVRNANEGEKFVSLDGETRTLTNEMLLICDGKKPIAIAGVMGGENSEVHAGTTNILIESAYFEPTGIRRTSKKLGLLTEASRRFEQGCDPENVRRALDRAAALIQELAGGQITEGIIDETTGEFPKKEVICRYSRINQLLGTQLSVSEVEDVFNRLQLPFVWDSDDTFKVSVPSYRHDLNIEVDVIEEVARIWGYDKIPREQLTYTASPLPHAPIYLLESEARKRLISEGLQEVLTCDLIGPSLLNRVDSAAFAENQLIQVQNPTSQEQSILRPSFLPGLLQVVKHNLDHQNRDLAAFEVGHIHFRQGDDVKEQSIAAIIITGNAETPHWQDSAGAVDFFDLKGCVENFLDGLRVNDPQYLKGASPLLHPGRQASIRVGDLDVGALGEVHPAVLRKMGIDQKVFYAEVNLHDLFNLRETDIKMSPLPVYPGSDRDWTLTVKEEVTAAQLFTEIQSVRSKLLKDVSLISVYRSDKIGSGLKNLTFSLYYRNDKKTLEQPAVDKEHGRIVSQVQQGLGDLIVAS